MSRASAPAVRAVEACGTVGCRPGCAEHRSAFRRVGERRFGGGRAPSEARVPPVRPSRRRAARFAPRPPRRTAGVTPVSPLAAPPVAADASLRATSTARGGRWTTRSPRQGALGSRPLRVVVKAPIPHAARHLYRRRRSARSSLGARPLRVVGRAPRSSRDASSRPQAPQLNELSRLATVTHSD